MPNHIRFEIFMGSKWDLCIYLRWPGAKSDIWKRFLCPSDDVCNESEACGVLQLSC